MIKLDFNVIITKINVIYGWTPKTYKGYTVMHSQKRGAIGT